ncbi:tyrosine-type recombinase/integrase [Winogradskya humida]|uniref:Integrase n=1 Tax=Winogradskya humida TaxID=113566 RepID=A0ABQ4A691_9ACTN|nr:site-specific integrase [Actinoplanes humidus]GIE26381.1 integrase [Actinoplanes humidus]
MSAGIAVKPRLHQLTVADQPLVQQSHPLSRADRSSIDSVLELLPRLPIWPATAVERNLRVRGARRILDWLATMPGDGWQDRWIAADIHDRSWMTRIQPDAGPRALELLKDGMRILLTARVVRPSYDFIINYRAVALFDDLRLTVSPDLFARAAAAALQLGMTGRRQNQPLVALTKLVLHTGKDLDQLEPEDFLRARAWSIPVLGRQMPGLHAAWELLSAVGVLPGEHTLRAALRVGQRPTAEIIDEFGLKCGPVRDVLVRYCEERRPALDFSSFRGLLGSLVRNFWLDLEQHHPGIDSLHLPADVALAWKERARTHNNPRIPGQQRRSVGSLFMRVRAFYLDIQQWALEDPSWAPFAVPCPIRKSDIEGHTKVRTQVTAEMHQRVRDRLPQLPVLVAAGERHRTRQQTLLASAAGVEVGTTFEHDGTTFVRSAPKSAALRARERGPEHVWATDVTTGIQVNVTLAENSAFWGWAVIETLRHTGVRLEELLEITHLALVSYQLPDTGEVVPLLQIVPSKSDTERLLLISPELASVLATIVKRIRDPHTGRIPLVAYYDPHERTTGPLLPHLFQHVLGWRREVFSHTHVRRLLNDVLALTGLTDATGRLLRFTPHDFRRIFATEAVAGGLPVHIAARLLGHEDIATTQAYLAVFQDDLIRAYRSFLTERRALRPTVEYREPTDAEWQEFQQHFQLRKLELGTCGRPYGTPCAHEHACVRCPMLRIDLAQRPRLVEITANLQDRIEEANANGWLGEVQGLTVSLDAARTKLETLDRRPTSALAVGLGIPVIRRQH